MSYWFTGSVGWTAVTAWAALTAKTAGALVRQLAAPAVGSERVFVAISASGVTGAAEPTWTITKGALTSSDGTVNWMECTGQPGVNGSLTYCPNWTAVKNTAVAQGFIIQNNAGTFLFVARLGGTAGNGAEPTWVLTPGSDTVDNGITWTCIGAVGNFGLRAAPFARLQSANTGTWGAPSDSFFIDDNSAETQAASMTINGPAQPTAGNQCSTYCVDHTVANPGTGDFKTTATITTTGNSSLAISQGGAYDGITFNCGTGAVNAGITLNPSGVRQIFRNCAFRKLGTTGSAAIQFNGGASASFYQELINCTMQFGSTADSIAGTHDFHVVWRDTPSAITGSTFPTTFFNNSSTSHGIFELYGVDLSALGSGTLYGGASGSLTVVMMNCKLGSGYVVGTPGAPGGRIDLINCDSGATNYNTIRSAFEGKHVSDITIVRTGGNPDNGTPNSWKITTTNQATWVNFFETMPLATNNLTLSTNRVVTAHGIWNSASLPNNDQIWLRVEYLGSASSPLSSSATQTKANNLAAGVALPADSTSAWDSAATARANTTSYSLGNVIKLASNPGRIFFCTTAGTSAGSEPGGYASAVDGGSVTDNAAVFRAGVRFLLTVTLSTPQPALAGYIKAVARSGAASTTFWVDPYLIPLG